MRIAALLATIAGLAWTSPLAATGEPVAAGRSFRLVLKHSSGSSDSKGGSGSSSGTDVLVETIVGHTAEGTTIEYDDVTPEGGDDADGDWRFPARVAYRPDGDDPVLLDIETLATRNRKWLARHKIDPAACGSWVFTWNAFKIECDPQSVIALLPSATMAMSGLSDRSKIKNPAGGTPLELREIDGKLRALGPVDAKFVARERAESDVVVGKILGKPITFEDALAKRSKDVINGTVEVTFEIADDGIVRKRSVVTRVLTVHPGGASETETSTSVLTRSDIGS